MKIPSASLLFCALFLAVPVLSSAASVAESNIFSLDTRNGATIRGFVVANDSGNATCGWPLQGATVSIGGKTVTTGADGRFEIRVSLPSATPLVITADNYMALQRNVGPVADRMTSDVGILELQQQRGGPVIESVTFEPDWNFLHGLGFETEVVARVNWQGYTPVRAELRWGDTVLQSVPASGTEIRIPLDIDSSFPSGSLLGMDLSMVAVGGTPASPSQLVSSQAMSEKIRIFPWPGFLRTWMGDTQKDVASVSLDFNLETKEKTVTLPVLGKFGYAFALGGSFDYGLVDGSWEAALGVGENAKQGKRGRRPKIPAFARYKSPHFYIGNRELECSFFAFGAGTAKLNEGIRVDEVGGGVSLSGRFELTRYGLLDLIGPGLTGAVRKVTGDAFVRNFSVRLDAILGVSGSAVFAPVWPPDFKEATVGFTGGPEAVYEPKVGKLKTTVTIGGTATGTFGYPSPYFRSVNLKGYAGLSVDAWIFNMDAEYVFLNYTWGPDRRLPAGAIPIDGGYLIPAAGNADGWAVMERPWRAEGGERFLLEPAAPGRRLSDAAEIALEAQGIFARMGGAASPGAVYQPVSGPDRRIVSDPDLPAQAELPILANIFPGSSPALAAKGSELMLLYVRDTGVANPVQFTEVAFTRFNGTSWSTPAALGSDARAQFAPQVVFDGNGDAVALFERVKDASYSGSDLNAYAGFMEIAWSRWSAASQTWSSPQALTDNGILDFQPQLAGPLSDGDLIATWMESPDNEMLGTVEHPQRVKAARWDAATQIWSAPEILIDSAADFIGMDLAAGSNQALFVWSRDADGNLEDSTDSELYYRIFQNDAWEAPVRFTSDAVADRNPQAWIDGSGNSFVAWNRDTELVLSQDFGVTSVARSVADNLSVADYALTGSSSGNLVLIWQEMGSNGSDAHYRVYDPASAIWGLDTQLSSDSDVESSFVPVWDATGNLTIAYNNTEVSLGTVSVQPEGGELIDVERVPQLGQADLMVAKRAIVRDLSIVSDSLTVEGLRFLTGDLVTLRAAFRNSGNVALEGVVVSFYDGDPLDGGTLIHSETITGWFAASDVRELSFEWTLPQSVQGYQVYAVVDPSGVITEFSEENNAAGITVGGVDLDVVYRSGDVLRDGSIRVVVDVTNLGSPASPISEIAIFNEITPDMALASISIGQLAPGETQSVVFELPAATQPQGKRLYHVSADKANLSGDVDTTNNTSSFALILWIDDDGDGLPQWWESAHGLSDSDPDDADIDSDGDGFTDGQEYLSGTDPKDSGSYLRMGQFSVVEQPSTGGQVNSFSWASAEGVLYDVQRSFDLINWETIVFEVIATPPLNSIVDELPYCNDKIYYRLMAK
jgi:hypothetical protein